MKLSQQAHRGYQKSSLHGALWSRSLSRAHGAVQSDGWSRQGSVGAAFDRPSSLIRRHLPRGHTTRMSARTARPSQLPALTPSPCKEAQQHRLKSKENGGEAPPHSPPIPIPPPEKRGRGEEGGGARELGRSHKGWRSEPTM